MQLSDPSTPSLSLQARSRSFHLAARLLPDHDLERVARLYAFCRYVDDLADEGLPGANDHELGQVRRDLLTAKSQHPIVQDLLKLQTECDLPLGPLLDFTEAHQGDQLPRVIGGMDELIRFSYGVAGTVGVLLCRLFGVIRGEADAFAIDLGIGMQLTNISRDVLEDAQRGRVYLPPEITGHRLAPARIAAGDALHRSVAFEAVQHLVDVADDYYASARAGYRFLPPVVRTSITAAAAFYRAIGKKIQRTPPEQYWRQRTVVTVPAKALLLSSAVARGLTEPLIERFNHRPPHRAHLHQAIMRRPSTP